MRIGPPEATWDDLVDWARLDEHQVPPVRVGLTTLEPFGLAGLDPGAGGPEARFLAALEPMYRHGGRRVLLFVHGYNTSFAEAAATLACMHHHQGRRGAAVLFSWPAGTQVVRYVEERALARDSTNALARLIALLHGPGRIERIDCLVNSTGAQMLMDALHQLDRTLGREAMPGLGIGSIVLASPDIALRDFATDDLDLVAATARRTVVYGSGDDRALRMSGWWHDGPRLGSLEGIDGDVRERLFRHRDRVEIVDITALPGPKDDDGFSRHGAWYANPLVVTDTICTLLWGRPAAERGLAPAAGAPVWTIPDDYAVQVARALAQPAGSDP
jgi:esterase/lipase superfamily enzyme